ncbi:hypothetical protein IWQ60_009846 [Tieghemiomyces parasiticus]|uniref:rhizopuspepsin n=1 Tax=Tieghemiomyces parasiticus TaxID=78921 RepID=A0A9W8DPH0_9FUNG|nr:hypothetical protein IWQ60_009846 [Tieghemiomyces parasiticus]
MRVDLQCAVFVCLVVGGRITTALPAGTSATIVYTDTLPNTPLSRWKAQLRYGRPDSLRNSPFQSKEAVEAINFRSDLEYYSAVSFGTPPQTFKVMLDTGSADTWVIARGCPTSKCANHATFDKTISTTYRNGSSDWQVTYGDHSFAGGFSGWDTLRIGALTITNQSLGLAMYASPQFTNDVVDGIVGLSFRGVSNNPDNRTPMDRLVEDHLLPEPLFAVYFPPRQVASVGEFTFGTVNSARYHGDLVYVPLSRKPYWQFELEAAYIGNTVVDQRVQCMVDTGTNVLLVSNEAARAIHLQIPGARETRSDGWIIPCSRFTASAATSALPGANESTTVSPAPSSTALIAKSQSFSPDSTHARRSDLGPALTIQFSINGHNFTVPVASLPLEPVKSRPGFCYSGVAGGSPRWILGTIFIKHNYVVFDHGRERLGFAPIRHSSS